MTFRYVKSIWWLHENFLIKIAVRATLPLQFLVLKLRSSRSRTIHTRDNPHKGWDASGGVRRRREDPAYSGRLSEFYVGQVEHMEI